jgi:hypothetical protein
MPYTTDKKYKQKKFETGELSKIVRKFFISFDQKPRKNSVTGHYSFEDGSTERKPLEVSDLGAISEIGKYPKSISISSDTGGFHYLGISGNNETLDFHLEMPNAEIVGNAISFLESELNLEKFIKKQNGDKTDLSSELEIMSTKTEEIEEYFHSERELRCFLSYRFNSYSKTIAFELMRFLELLGVEVITGKGYEPRNVNEKVLSRLDNLDFIIYLITKDGESSWTRDEMAVSIGKGYYVVPLLENGSKIDRGILGDIEYIPFDHDHIGDTFISLIEAINFIRKNK